MWLRRPAPRLPPGDPPAQIAGTCPFTEAPCPPGDPGTRIACSDAAGFPARPGNSDAHDPGRSLPGPAPSSAHGHATTNAPAIPMPQWEDTDDRLAACQPLPLRTTAPVPTPPPTRCRLPAPCTSDRHPTASRTPTSDRGLRSLHRRLRGPQNCSLRCSPAVAGRWPHSPIFRLPFWEFSPQRG